MLLGRARIETCKSQAGREMLPERLPTRVDEEALFISIKEARFL